MNSIKNVDGEHVMYNYTFIDAVCRPTQNAHGFRNHAVYKWFATIPVQVWCASSTPSVDSPTKRKDKNLKLKNSTTIGWDEGIHFKLWQAGNYQRGFQFL